MRTVKLGTSDLMINEVGMGTMSLPKNVDESVYLVQEAIEHGVNFLDLADLYQFGEVEKKVGKAIKGRREDVILATKGGNHWEEGKEGWFWDPSKKYIKEACKKSLQRLGTDYIDLYQLHGGTLDDPIDETIEAFEELRDEGYIRWYGISSIRPNVIREYVQRSNISSVMMQYSMLDRRPEEKTLALLEDNDVGVIGRGPVGKGMLSDKGLSKIPEKGYLDYSPDELKHIISELQNLLKPYDNLSEAAIHYALYPNAVKAVTPGASSKEQLLTNIKATEAPKLSEDQIKAIRALTKANTYEKHR